MKVSRVIAAACLCGLATTALAETVPSETARQGKQQITVHLQPFLTPDELTTLRLVASNEQALGLFVTPEGGHSAIAVAPAEGFVRDGAPVASAIAISGLANTEAARKAAIEACNAARKKGPDCVVVLDVTPLR